VSSVSCIYGLGTPEYYSQMVLHLKLKQEARRDDVLLHLVEMHYTRSDYDLSRGTFRARGDVLEIVPAYEDDIAYRIEFFGDEIERISSIDPITGKVRERLEKIAIFPGSHYVTPENIRYRAIDTIRKELAERIAQFEKENKLVEAQRIKERTRYDLEMIREIGFCKGIENYSRHFSGRGAGEPPPCLIDYFPDNFLFFIDESHQTLPQLHAMYSTDRARKRVLIEYGFRLPSALDNRPLNFEEFEKDVNQVVYVSATPGPYEQRKALHIIEQLVRPTGLLEPSIEIRRTEGQVKDLIEEIKTRVLKNQRTLVITLTKRLSEALTDYLIEAGIKTQYLHSEIKTLERPAILKDFREGKYDVLVGINLLREGLDLPEVSLIAILDADKEGFLRNETTLIQTMGRAARHIEGKVIMYADKKTLSIKKAIKEVSRRRRIQETYNKKHGITPQTIVKTIKDWQFVDKEKEVGLEFSVIQDKRLLEKEMTQAAKNLDFERASEIRDLIKNLKDDNK